MNTSPRTRRGRTALATALGAGVLAVASAVLAATPAVSASATVNFGYVSPALVHGATPMATVPVADQWVTRSGSSLMLAGRRWRPSGVNEYWLGLDDNVSDAQGATYPAPAAVDQGMAAAAALGSRLVRATTLGVSVGCARCLEPSRGVFNDTAFTAIDYAVASARRHGLRLMIPLTDEWHYYHGGKHVFTSWFGEQDLPGQTVSTSSVQREREATFYSSPSDNASFQRYIHHLMTHVNPLTGLSLADDPTIAIWETGNELWDAPPAWTERTAAFIKSLAPRALVADGTDSTGVDIRNTGVAEPDVDIEDAHFYPVDASRMVSQASFTAQHGKVYLIGEYPLSGGPWLTNNFLSTSSADGDVSGMLAWTMLPWLPDHRPEPHGEVYTLHYPWTTALEERGDLALKAQSGAMAG